MVRFHRFRRLRFLQPLLLFLICELFCQGQPPGSLGQANAPLTAEQIVERMERQNRQRAEALGQFEGTRVYRMQYRGFPSNRDAEMTVQAMYKSPATKDFKVLSQSGSKFIIEHIFMKLLEGEKEALQPENRNRTTLNTTNYDFVLDRSESTPHGSQYVLSVQPKIKNKFLFRGKIWVDAGDFAVTHLEAEPAKNPSFWIKKSEITQRYVKVGDFWLPAENHTESQIRLGGRAILSIEYRDYKITAASPLNRVESAQDKLIASPSVDAGPLLLEKSPEAPE